MPIVVKELFLSFNGGEQANCKADKDKKTQANAASNANDIDNIVATCVEQVLDILERAQER
jgi:hypothetical protein